MLLSIRLIEIRPDPIRIIRTSEIEFQWTPVDIGGIEFHIGFSLPRALVLPSRHRSREPQI